MYSLGRMCSEGLGVTRDNSAALRWYEKAAEKGIDEAMLSLGWLYQNGCGCDVDGDKALEYY